MINGVTTKVNVDRYLLSALSEDITGEDVTTNAVMPEPRRGTADLLSLIHIYRMKATKRENRN